VHWWLFFAQPTGDKDAKKAKEMLARQAKESVN